MECTTVNVTDVCDDEKAPIIAAGRAAHDAGVGAEFLDACKVAGRHSVRTLPITENLIGFDNLKGDRDVK